MLGNIIANKFQKKTYEERHEAVEPTIEQTAGPRTAPQGQMRGGGGDTGADDDNAEFTGTENFIISYGCQPSDGVPAKSTIAISYFKWLR